MAVGGKRPESRCVSSQPWRHAKGKTFLDINSWYDMCTVSSSLSCAPRPTYCLEDEARCGILLTNLALIQQGRSSLNRIVKFFFSKVRYLHFISTWSHHQGCWCNSFQSVTMCSSLDKFGQESKLTGCCVDRLIKSLGSLEIAFYF